MVDGMYRTQPMQISSKLGFFSLRDSLTRLKKDSQPVTEYLKHIRSISDELSKTGAPITNSELIVEILSGLGSEFSEISASIRAHDSTISYEELYQKLLDHELSKHAPNQITTAAATSTRSGNSNSWNTCRSNRSNQQWWSNNCSITPNQY